MGRVKLRGNVSWIVCLLLCAGCNQFDPSQWDKAKVEAEIAEKHQLVELNLTPAEGGFTGSGKDAGGETFKITVRQNAAEKSVSYNLDGDRGSFFENKVSAAPR